MMIRAIIVGLIAGWLAGKMMRGYGYGALCDIVLGLIGGVVGSMVFGVFGLHAAHVIGSVTVSTVGALLLVAGARVLGDEL
jgi:uncharacterized membrane protein YeaQ/YmgE (transglycosylase-associated protein family)